MYLNLESFVRCGCFPPILLGDLCQNLIWKLVESSMKPNHSNWSSYICPTNCQNAVNSECDLESINDFPVVSIDNSLEILSEELKKISSFESGKILACEINGRYVCRNSEHSKISICSQKRPSKVFINIQVGIIWFYINIELFIVWGAWGGKDQEVVETCCFLCMYNRHHGFQIMPTCLQSMETKVLIVSVSTRMGLWQQWCEHCCTKNGYFVNFSAIFGCQMHWI